MFPTQEIYIISSINNGIAEHWAERIGRSSGQVYNIRHGDSLSLRSQLYPLLLVGLWEICLTSIYLYFLFYEVGLLTSTLHYFHED